MPIARLLAALVLAVSAAAGTFPVADAPLGTPPSLRTVPQLIAGANGALAFWLDSRSGEDALIATRIAANGDVLDPTGILLSRRGPIARGVWNGERYALFLPRGNDIAMLTIDEDGTVSPMQTVVANAKVANDQPVSVATNGRRIVIAYAGDADGFPTKPRMHAAVLSMNGTLVEDMVLDAQRADRLAPSVATNNDAFVVAWNVAAGDRFQLHATRLSSSGVLLDAEPRTAGSDYLEATLRANGDGFLAITNNVTWFVSADLATTSTPIERQPGNAFTLRGNVAFASRDFPTETSAATPSYLQITQYDAGGNAGLAKRILAATPDASTSLEAANGVQRGDDVVLAWLVASFTALRAETAIADAHTLQVKSSVRTLTQSAPRQQAPAVAIGETESLVAWLEDDAVYAARVLPDGRRLDGRGMRIADANAITGPPKVALHDGLYAVAFTDESAVHVRFISPVDGLLPNAVRIPGDRLRDGIALASGGGALLLAWSAEDRIHVTRIHANATYDPPIVVSEGAALQPVLAWNGTHFLAAWIDFILDFDRGYQRSISGRRITADLASVDAQSRVVAQFSEYAMHDEPALASDGHDWFLAATHVGYPEQEVRVVHIGADGVPLDASGTVVGRGFAPALTWAGSRLVLARKDDTDARTLLVTDLGTNATQTYDAQTPGVDAYLFRNAIGIAARNDQWAVVYPCLDDSGVPRVMITFSARSQPKRRALH